MLTCIKLYLTIYTNYKLPNYSDTTMAKKKAKKAVKRVAKKKTAKKKKR